jgi:hypothetical protein
VAAVDGLAGVEEAVAGAVVESEDLNGFHEVLDDDPPLWQPAIAPMVNNTNAPCAKEVRMVSVLWKWTRSRASGVTTSVSWGPIRISSSLRIVV